MSLNNILKGKVIRPRSSQSTGIFILKAEAWVQANSFILSVRYFDLNNHEDGMTEDRDLLTIDANSFLDTYEICYNSEEIDSFKQAKFQDMAEFLATWLEGK